MNATSGQLAEREAQKFLEKQGLALISKNFSCKLGEIDLIMRDNKCITFVEVRYRASTRFGSAAETVTASKQAKLIKTAQYYLQKNNQLNKRSRFDVVAISPKNGELNIQWYKDAFSA